MLAVVAAVLLSGAPAVPASTRCDSVVRVAHALMADRRRGVSRASAVAVVDEQESAEARRIGRALVWYVYVANADHRTPPAKAAQLVRRACMSSERNALSGD